MRGSVMKKGDADEGGCQKDAAGRARVKARSASNPDGGRAVRSTGARPAPTLDRCRAGNTGKRRLLSGRRGVAGKRRRASLRAEPAARDAAGVARPLGRWRGPGLQPRALNLPPHPAPELAGAAKGKAKGLITRQYVALNANVA